MSITRAFTSGDFQIVLIPAEFKITSGEVEIFRRNNDIVIRERSSNLAKAFDLLTQLSKGFFKHGRKDTLPQTRDL